MASIPLSLNTRVDSLIWHFDKQGHYTVRSSYHVARSLSQQRSDVLPKLN